MNKSFFKISIRRAINHPMYSIVNILGLSLGLACFIVVMLWAKHEISYDRFHENSDQLYRVAFTNKTGEYHGYYQTGTLAGYLRQNFPEIVQSTSFNVGQCKVAFETQGFYCKGSYADSAFFKMFTFPFITGDATTALDQSHSAVITESLSKKLFGNVDPIGKLIKIDENTQYAVTGVIRDIPDNSMIQFDLLMPYCDALPWMKTWNSKWTQTYVMLEKGSNPEEVSNKISGVMNIFQPSWENILYLTPLTESHLHNLTGGGLIVYVWVFSLMAVVILLLACINFMNLATSRSELRLKEIFIKKIVGSKRFQVSAQFISEAILIAFVSLAIATLAVKIMLPFVNTMLQAQLHLSLNLPTILILISITILTGLIAGSYPAFYLSTIMPEKIINRKHKSSGSGKWNFRYALVVFQFTISVFFISCTFLVSKQLKFLQTKDLGIKKENIIKLSTFGSLGQKAEELKFELLQNPSIERVTVSNNDLTSWANSGPIDWEGRDRTKLIEIGYNWVDEDFLETFNLKMKEGRFFSKEFASDRSNAFIINQKAVSYLGLDNPIGMKVKTWFGVEGTIIGVVEDFNTTSLHNEMGPIALLAGNQVNCMFIRISGQDVPETLKFINAKVKELVPDDPFDYQFFDEHINNLYKTETLTGRISIALTLLAIFISCLGLLGLALSTLDQRVKEIGIRKVNGAKVSEILSLLNKDFVIWIGTAVIISTPLAYYAMHKWLENFAYKTEINWWIFALSGLLALGIALLTVSFQSWKAATRNPVEALRYE
jgi:putative ABC transport system permease protein